MPTEVICALIAFSGAILSAFISFLVSRSTANKEIEKMRLSWDREDTTLADEAFSQMIHAVREYISCENEYFKYGAMNAVDALQLKESDAVNAVLAQLHDALRLGSRPQAEQLLAAVVEAKKNDKRKKVTAKRGRKKS